MNRGQALGPAVAHDRAPERLCRRADGSERDGLARGGQALRLIPGRRQALPAIRPDADRRLARRGGDAEYGQYGGAGDAPRSGGWCGHWRRGWQCRIGSRYWCRQWSPVRDGHRCRGRSWGEPVPPMALRRLVYAMHVCERESTPGHAHGPPVQLCAAAPGHAPAPERCAETASDGATAALRSDRSNRTKVRKVSSAPQVS